MKRKGREKFVVYAHCKPDGSVYYIGKGYLERAMCFKRKHRSLFWARTTDKYFGETGIPVVKILSENITDDDTAFRIEQFWIAVFGRRDLKLGLLVNLSDGGEGPSGYIPSVETIRKMKLARVGRKPSLGMRHTAKTKQLFSEQRRGAKNTNYGKKHSENIRTKMSINRGALPVILIDPSGKEYVVQNRTQFATEHGLCSRGINGLIHGRYRTHRGWRIQYPFASLVN